VLFGPHVEACADLAELLLAAEVGFQVANARELAQEFVRLARPAGSNQGIAARAHALMERQRGASARCVQVAAKLLAAERPR
jgi:3-deoxy-D-manno-octulosonic-acid transferase